MSKERKRGSLRALAVCSPVVGTMGMPSAFSVRCSLQSPGTLLATEFPQQEPRGKHTAVLCWHSIALGCVKRQHPGGEGGTVLDGSMELPGNWHAPKSTAQDFQHRMNKNSSASFKNPLSKKNSDSPCLHTLEGDR